MGRGTTFVVVYSVILLALFGTFCYLMSIVNPKPLLEQEVTTTTGKTEKSPAERQSDKDIEANNVKYMEEQAEVIKTLATKLHTDVNGSLIKRRKNIVKVVPPSRSQGSNSTILTKLNNVTVSHTSGDTNTTDKYTKAEYNNGLGNTTLATVENNLSLTLEMPSAPVKGFRRSVKEDNDEYVEEVRKEDDSNSVILKIMDDKGQSRIEIKLGSIGFARRKNRSPGKNPKLNMLIKDKASAKLKKNRLFKNTIIKVMPDNSLVVNDDSQQLSYYSGSTNYDLQNKKDATNDSPDTNITLKAFLSRENDTSQIKSSVDGTLTENLQIKYSNNRSEHINDLNPEFKLKILIDNKTETIPNFEQFVNAEIFSEDNNETILDPVTKLYNNIAVNLTETSNITNNMPAFEHKDKKSDVIEGRHSATLEQIDFTEFNDSINLKKDTLTLYIITTAMPKFSMDSEQITSTITIRDNTTAKLPSDTFEDDNVIKDTGDGENNTTNSPASSGSSETTIPIQSFVTTDGVIQLTSRAKVKSKQILDVRDLNDVNGNITNILVK